MRRFFRVSWSMCYSGLFSILIFVNVDIELKTGHCFVLLRLLIIIKITERFGLGDTFKGYLDQPPAMSQGHLQLDEVAQSPVQSSLECFQGWYLITAILIYVL